MLVLFKIISTIIAKDFKPFGDSFILYKFGFDGVIRDNTLL